MKFTYDEAYNRYTQRFTHTELEVDGEVTYQPMSVCTHSELDKIFADSSTWDEVLNAMRAKIGTAGPPRKGR